MRHLILLALLILPGWTAHAVEAVDATGRTVTLDHPAQRIISLAPHATELLFAAGLGDRLVGAAEYSDYPEAARAIPRIGGFDAFDMELILALEPDLVVGWRSGNPAPAIERLRVLGLTLYLSEPRTLVSIADEIEHLGRLGGSEEAANAAADAFRGRLGLLRARYSKRPAVRVFYQLWHRPLMTVGGTHLVSEVIRLCGGENVFGDLDALAPTVDREAVLARDPQAIVASGMDRARPEWLDDWRRWPDLAAVHRGNLFFIPPDLLQRHTPRMLDGAELFCRQLESARDAQG